MQRRELHDAVTVRMMVVLTALHAYSSRLSVIRATLVINYWLYC